MQEYRTAGIVADFLQKLDGCEVTSKVGVTGVVGVLKNGQGPTVMLRADMDALPMAEATGLPYASSAVAKDEDGVENGVDRKSVVQGKSVSVRVDLGVRRILKKKKHT